METSDNVNDTIVTAQSQRKRSQLENVRNFFKIEGNCAKCDVAECSGKLYNITNTNFKRHLQVLHKDIAMANGWLESEHARRKKYSIELDENEFKLNLARLFTEDAAPFTLLTKSSFKGIIRPICQTLQLTVNDSTVKSSIEKVYLKYKSAMSLKTK